MSIIEILQDGQEPRQIQLSDEEWEAIACIDYIELYADGSLNSAYYQDYSVSKCIKMLEVTQKNYEKSSI